MALDTRLTPRRIDALLRVALNVRRASMCRPGVRLMDKVYKTVTKSINPLKLDLAEQKMASTVYCYCSRGACRSARPSWRRRSSRAITRGSKLADALETWARSTRRASPSGAGRRGARAAARRPAALPAGRWQVRAARNPRTRGVGGVAKEVTVVGGGGEIPSAARKPRSITYVDNVRTSTTPARAYPRAQKKGPIHARLTCAHPITTGFAHQQDRFGLLPPPRLLPAPLPSPRTCPGPWPLLLPPRPPLPPPLLPAPL